MAKKSDQFKQENSKDKRVRGTVKKLAAKLWELFTPKQIGKKLGVSTQKATAIKKGINSGKIYSPEVKKILEKEINKEKKKQETKIKNESIRIEVREFAKEKGLKVKDFKGFLKDQGVSFADFKKQADDERKKIESEFANENKQIGKDGEIYYPSAKVLNKDYTGYKVASYAHHSYESALNWWKGVTGGAGYFVILRKKSKKTGREIFYVMDIDPNRKRGEGKKSKKKNNYASDRALKLEEKFLESEDI